MRNPFRPPSLSSVLGISKAKRKIRPIAPARTMASKTGRRVTRKIR